MKKLGKHPNGIYRLSHNGTLTNEYAIVLGAGNGDYSCVVIQTDDKMLSFPLGTCWSFPESKISNFKYMASVRDWVDVGHPKFVTARELITWDLKEIEQQKYIIVKDYE